MNGRQERIRGSSAEDPRGPYRGLCPATSSDGKKALAEWTDLSTASVAITEAVEEAGIEFDAVGGPTMGADALAVGITAANHSRWFFICKQPKGHGTGRRIEGVPVGSGTRVLLVDDVVTGATIVGVVALVDRGDSAGPRIAVHDIAYLPMATYADLGIDPVRPEKVAAIAT